MPEPRYNPNDQLFLLSRSLDGDLTPAEEQRLEEALARSPQLHAEGEHLRRVDRLVRAWGKCETNIDAEALTKEVGAFLRSDAVTLDTDTTTEESTRVDRLLQRWALPDVALDEARFTAGVLRRIVQEHRLRTVRHWVIRLGTPLAAAAVIALAFISRTGPFDGPVQPQGPSAIVRVHVGPQVATGSAAPPAVCQVRFVRETSAAEPLTVVPRGVSYAWAGPAPAGPGSDAPWPW